MGLDINLIVEKFRKLIESEESKKNNKEYFDNIQKRKDIVESQVDRFFEYIRISEYSEFARIVEKVIAKYNSEEYVNRWYSRSIEPQEELYWFLFEFAKKYGSEATEEEWKEYGNIFTHELYYYGGYYFNLMYGQGAVVQIEKVKK